MNALLLALAVASPAHALGVVVGKGDAQPKVMRVRAMVAADRPPDDLTRRGRATVSAQVLVDSALGGWAWLVPLPGGDRSELSRYESEHFDRLFLGTSPAYQPVSRLEYETTGCLGGSGTLQPLDTGQLAMQPLPLASYWHAPDETNLDREGSVRVAAAEVERVLGELEVEGYGISSTLHAELAEHAAAGGDLLVVRMYAPAEGSVGVSDVFSWKSTAHEPLMPLGMLRHQPDTLVLFDLHLAGEARWAPDGLAWEPPVIPDALLMSPSSANPYWQQVLAGAWDRGALLHTHGGSREDLEARSAALMEAITEHSSVYSDIVQIQDGVLETAFAAVLFAPIAIFEDLFSSWERDDQVDDLFRSQQADDLLPSGWRKDDKVHMAFQGVLDTNLATDLTIREDDTLRFREVLLGGGRETVVGSAWPGLGLLGLTGFAAFGLRRRADLEDAC